jgi:hypothetical protein
MAEDMSDKRQISREAEEAEEATEKAEQSADGAVPEGGPRPESTSLSQTVPQGPADGPGPAESQAGSPPPGGPGLADEHESLTGGGEGPAVPQEGPSGGPGPAIQQAPPPDGPGPTFQQAAPSGGQGPTFQQAATPGGLGATFHQAAPPGGPGPAFQQAAPSGGQGPAFHQAAPPGGQGPAFQQAAPPGGPGPTFQQAAPPGGPGPRAVYPSLVGYQPSPAAHAGDSVVYLEQMPLSVSDVGTVVEEVQIEANTVDPLQPPEIIQTRKFIFPGQSASRLKGKDDWIMSYMCLKCSRTKLLSLLSLGQIQRFLFYLELFQQELPSF